MITKEQQKQIEQQRQVIIDAIDPILDKVCEANDYELYGGIEKALDCDLSAFKSFELDKLEKIQEMLRANRITRRLEKDDDQPKHKTQERSSTPISTDASIKTKKQFILTFYKDGMSVGELAKVSGINYRNCYNALKSINKL